MESWHSPLRRLVSQTAVQTGISVGRGFIPRSQGDHGGNFRDVAGFGVGWGVLLPLFPGHQVHWWLLPHSLPQQTQHLLPIPHGEPHFSKKICFVRLLRRVGGSQGCLLACSDSPLPLVVSSSIAPRNPIGELIVYQWKVLPFGFATAPRVFTEPLAPVAAHLHL